LEKRHRLVERQIEEELDKADQVAHRARSRGKNRFLAALT